MSFDFPPRYRKYLPIEYYKEMANREENKRLRLEAKEKQIREDEKRKESERKREEFPHITVGLFIFFAMVIMGFYFGA